MSGEVLDTGHADHEVVAALELFESVSVAICPRTLALNTELDTTTATVICRQLAADGLLQRLDRHRPGYEITPRGEDYLAGNAFVGAPQR